MQEFTGKQYLQIAIANAYGMDKLTWDERLAWFQMNQDNLDSLLDNAEEPAMYFAAVNAYREVLEGNPIGFPLGLDATASGIQLLGVLTGCEKTCEQVNVVDLGSRADFYTNAYEEICNRLGQKTKVSRDDTKKAIMTNFYGSIKVPQEVFGEGEQYDVFLQVMEELAPGAWKLNKLCLMLWDPEATLYEWRLPDNFYTHFEPVKNIYTDFMFRNAPYTMVHKEVAATEKGRSISPNLTHSLDGYVVREIHRRCMYDPISIERVTSILKGEPVGNPSSKEGDDYMVHILWEHYKQTDILSARILDHITYDNFHMVDASIALNLIETLPPKPFKVKTVHDQFFCHPNNMNHVRRLYNTLLAEVACSNLLSVMLSSITKKDIQIATANPELAKKILTTNYSLS